jgi:hypothetical protein
LLCEAGRYRDQANKPRGKGMGDERKKRISPHVLRVVVSAEERAAIDGAADRLGMSTSAYLRSLGLGYQPIGHLDKEAAEHLVRVNADLSRLGNLLKLWLSDDAKLAVFKPGQAVEYIGRLLPAIHANQVQMYEILQGLIRQGSPLRSRLGGKARAPI